MTSTALRSAILHAMRRLASKGEVDVSPSRIADLVAQRQPRPSEGAMWRAIDALLDDGEIVDGRKGLDRFRLAPAPWAPEAEQVSMDVGA